MSTKTLIPFILGLLFTSACTVSKAEEHPGLLHQPVKLLTTIENGRCRVYEYVPWDMYVFVVCDSGLQPNSQSVSK